MTPIKQFDIVMLKSVKNVDYVSGPSGHAARPQGRWTVVWANDTNLKVLLAKDETVIQIPKEDVIKIGDYSVEKVFELVQRVRTKEDLDKILGVKKDEGTKEEG